MSRPISPIRRRAGRVAVCLAIGLWSVTPGAAADDCAARITVAWEAVAAVPGYRQIVEMPARAMKIEQVVIGDTIHTRTDGKWNTITLKPGGRRAMTAKLAGETPTISCAVLADETIDGVATTVLDSTRAPVAGLEPGPVRQKLWIGKNDGLVRRLQSDRVTITVAYDGVVAPR